MMKRTILVLSMASLFILGCGNNKEEQPTNNDSIAEDTTAMPHPEWFVEENAVGELTIDMPIEEMKEMFMLDQIVLTTESMEGMEYNMYEIYFHEKSQLSVIVEPSDIDGVESILRMYVYDPNCKTKEGIGAGSSIAELKEAYTIESCFGSVNGEIFVDVAEFENLTFAIEQDDIEVLPEEIIKEDKIKDDWKIAFIYVY